MSITVDKARGIMFGTAFGDSLAAPTEFIRDIKEIEKRFGKGGPVGLVGDPAKVTDDTQMALAVGRALVQCDGDYRPANLEPYLRREFITWLHDPENNRAPGTTCLAACGRLARGYRWQEATIIGSKGCGANMRVAPVALLDVSLEQMVGIAQFQASLTHGHPTALAASDLTAYAMKLLAVGAEPNWGFLGQLQEYAFAMQKVYHHDYLGDLWKVYGAASPEAYIGEGWGQCLDALGKVVEAYENLEMCAGDPCLLTGEGWVAEEAFATGLLCFLLHSDSPVEAIRRGAVTCGDSDSIASLAGAFAGAHLGVSYFPYHWREQIEYATHLEGIVEALYMGEVK